MDNSALAARFCWVKAVLGVVEMERGGECEKEYSSMGQMFHVEHPAPYKYGNLYVEVCHIQRVSFNEIAAWFHCVTHQSRENLISCDGILNRHP